jgi:hypothetical protein
MAKDQDKAGEARGLARQEWRRGEARPCKARLGKARGEARQGEERPGKRQFEARGKARHGARQEAK